jgi:hypothetical protein
MYLVEESEIPYSKGIIANAPILLTHYEISQHLDRDKQHKTLLKRFYQIEA